MNSVAEGFEHLYKVISSSDFLEMKSLGGEIPFFISPHEAKDQVEVDKAIKGLRNKLENHGIPVLEINLYDLAMMIINRELGQGEIFELEKEMDKDEFKEALQSILDINEVLMPAIRQLIASSGAKVYFLTGIGLVFPFIRSHNILNNLQNVAKDAPTVAFFPGKYNGYSLELFGLLKDDNYYRAFNIDNYKLKA
ncbi:DUF1788 domain-containing protein [Pontibacter flavimaris]|uniref:DUF1788 domain-containing protein n=1 Tax=Pontibacter flavimaris TaxID=1797110 RepID=A0A1Q5PIP2_9BACT|nr:DUF1788 domain-containing protein [Pontibacter flavimaris]OKL42080.1 hypothetical protein A3841_08770 [Pontibacter flavimaris]